MKSILSIAILASVFAISGCDNNSDTESKAESKTEVQKKAVEQPQKQVTKKAAGQGVRSPNGKVAAEDHTFGKGKQHDGTNSPVKKSGGSSPETINLWKKQWKTTQTRMEADTKKSKEPQIIIIKK